jgi:hypothetical protein
MQNANPNIAHSVIDLGYIARLVWRKKVPFLFILMTSYISSILFINLLPKYFVCETTIRLLPKHEYDPLPFFTDNNSFSENEFEASAAKITMNSSDFLQDVVKELDLSSKYGISDTNPEIQLNRTIQALRSDISIKDLQSNNILLLKVTKQDRNLSLSICNTLLNNFQKRKTNELNTKNQLIVNQLNKAIDQKTRNIDSIENVLSIQRSKYKILTTTENNSKQIIYNNNKDNGYYGNFDKVVMLENRLKELNNTFVEDIDKLSILNSIQNSNYPVFEILAPPYLPVMPNNYNGLLLNSLIILVLILLTTSILVILDLKR